MQKARAGLRTVTRRRFPRNNNLLFSNRSTMLQAQYLHSHSGRTSDAVSAFTSLHCLASHYCRRNSRFVRCNLCLLPYFFCSYQCFITSWNNKGTNKTFISLYKFPATVVLEVLFAIPSNSNITLIFKHEHTLVLVIINIIYETTLNNINWKNNHKKGVGSAGSIPLRFLA